MNDYDTPEERAALEDELESLPAEEIDTSKVYPRISVRLSGDDLETIERAANAAGIRLSTFIREAAIAAASEASAVTERRQLEERIGNIRDLLSKLQSDVHNHRYATAVRIPEDEHSQHATRNGN